MQLSELRGNQQYADRAFRGLAIAAAGLVLLVLGMIAVVMTRRAWPALFGETGEHDAVSIYLGLSGIAVVGVLALRKRMAKRAALVAIALALANAAAALVVMIAALPFFHSTRWSAPDHIFGALPFIWGTLYTALIALALAVPVSLGVALFVTQVAPPLEKCGRTIGQRGALTGLPEYRNGGLFVDLGVIVPKRDEITSQIYAAGDEVIVEWRALTVALLDRVAELVQQKLGKSPAELPLACVLEGGTWAAGRAVAAERRPGGGPPIRIHSDGTVF